MRDVRGTTAATAGPTPSACPGSTRRTTSCPKSAMARSLSSTSSTSHGTAGSIAGLATTCATRRCSASTRCSRWSLTPAASSSPSAALSTSPRSSRSRRVGSSRSSTSGRRTTSARASEGAERWGGDGDPLHQRRRRVPLQDLSWRCRTGTGRMEVHGVLSGCEEQGRSIRRCADRTVRR